MAGLFKKAERWVSRHIPHQHSADRRNANRAAAEQISYYKTQKDEMAKESKRIEDERASEKDKVARKQVKSLRHAFRAPGFMEEASADYGDKLG